MYGGFCIFFVALNFILFILIFRCFSVSLFFHMFSLVLFLCEYLICTILVIERWISTLITCKWVQVIKFLWWISWNKIWLHCLLDWLILTAFFCIYKHMRTQTHTYARARICIHNISVKFSVIERDWWLMRTQFDELSAIIPTTDRCIQNLNWD